MWIVRIPNRVRNYIKKLPEKYRISAISSLDDIKSDPHLGKPLRRELKGYCSYQFGPYRIIYKFDQKSKNIDIVNIGHRRLVYN